MLLWGKDTHAIPPFSGDEPIAIGGATILPSTSGFWASRC